MVMWTPTTSLFVFLLVPTLAIAGDYDGSAYVKPQTPPSCDEFLASGTWTPQVTPRSLAEEATWLFRSSTLSTIQGRDIEGWQKIFFRFIPEDVTVMELGAGVGRAMSELLVKKRVRGIAVDVGDHVRTQDLAAVGGGRQGSDEYARREARRNWNRSQALKGEYVAEVGYAEDVLLKYPNQIARLWDTYGAFSYTPRRILLLERIYDALTEAGVARLYCGFDSATLRPARLMVALFPKIFSLERLSPEMGDNEYVLVVKKVKGLAILKTGLVDGKVLKWAADLGVPVNVEILKRK